MQEEIRQDAADQPETTAASPAETALDAPEAQDSALDTAEEVAESPEEALPEETLPEEEPVFVSDFLLNADGFYETASFAYLRVTNNAWILLGLYVVYFVASLIAGKITSLLPIVGVIIAVVTYMLYGNTKQQIKNAHARQIYITKTSESRYHIALGEHIRMSVNGLPMVQYDYSTIRSICQTAHYYLLCMDQQIYIAVAKADLQGGTEEELLQFLFHSCPYLKNKKVPTTEGKERMAMIATFVTVAVTLLSLIPLFL